MRDRAGFEQGRRRDEQGRPLKLQIGGGTSSSYAENYEATFGHDRLRDRLDESLGKLFDWGKCEDCGRPVPKRSRRDRDAALVCGACLEK